MSSLSTRITDLATRIGQEVKSVWAAINAKEPSFSKNTAFNKTFGTGSGTVTEGNDSRLSDARTPSDSSVTVAKLSTALKTRAAISGAEIDWSAGVEFTKTLSGNTTFTDANIEQNKVIVLWLSGNYSITFPAYWNIEKGSETYTGTVMNKVVAHCKEDGTDEVWYYITQQG